MDIIRQIIRERFFDSHNNDNIENTINRIISKLKNCVISNEGIKKFTLIFDDGKFSFLISSIADNNGWKLENNNESKLVGDAKEMYDLIRNYPVQRLLLKNLYNRLWKKSQGS